MNKTIKICSKEYELKTSKKIHGAYFHTARKKDSRGEIGITSKATKEITAGYIIHEVIEAILTEDDKRFYNYTNSSEDPNYVFMFDHDYLCGLVHKILDALLSSGIFKLNGG